MSNLSGVFVALMVSAMTVACDHGRISGRATVAQQPATARVDERGRLRDQLAAHRTQEMERLREYARAGAFPVNTTHGPTGHFFKDSLGHYCAVANLVHQDGRDEVVDEVVRTNNALVVSDVHAGALYDWMLTSGLTQEELARIQRPAPMVFLPAKARSAVVPEAIALPSEDKMRTDLRAELDAVEEELLRDTDRSLDLAVERLVAPRHPQG
jgi:hypothetical protein